MQCVIICGGLATRLYPITEKIPKSLVEIKGKTVIEHQINALKKYGVNELILCAGHLHEKLKSYLDDGSKFGVDIRYSIENEPLGTSGALKNVNSVLLKDDFLLLYGDILIELDIKKFFDFHLNKKAIATLCLHKSSHPYDSDIAVIDKNNQLIKFDRVKEGDDFINLTSAAFYVLNKKILQYIDRKSDFIKNAFPKAILNNERIFGYVTEEFIHDMGTVERLSKLQKKL